ncbi:MAG TPA: hypothetical protein VGD58_20725 [Herpetosiphonaceae bacterium]
MSNKLPHDPASLDALHEIAAYLRRNGLATPALMLLQIARPLSFLGSQSLLMIQPILPVQRLQAGIGQTARALEDEAAWTRLEKLLQ